MSSDVAQYETTDVEGLKASLDGHVLTIRFDRPAKRNAITYDMYLAMTALLRTAAADEHVRCVVFTGSGVIFSAGHDVGGFARGMALEVEDKPSFGFMRALAAFPKIVIAALNGDAVGIGATMLFHCDLVYAARGAELVFPFMKMGLVPEFASTFYLPRMIGHRHAMALFAREGRCSAERAIGWGLVNDVIDVEMLAAFTTKAARAIAALSPDAVRETKRLMKERDGDAVYDAIAGEAYSFHALLQSDFARQRLDAIRGHISGGATKGG